jgi:hypothetical protein
MKLYACTFIYNCTREFFYTTCAINFCVGRSACQQHLQKFIPFGTKLHRLFFGREMLPSSGEWFYMNKGATCSELCCVWSICKLMERVLLTFGHQCCWSWSGRPARPRPTALLPSRSNGKTEATTAVYKLLMIVKRMPETCWAVFKRQAINLRDWCIWLVYLFECMMMHGLTNPKLKLIEDFCCNCNNYFTKTYILRPSVRRRLTSYTITFHDSLNEECILVFVWKFHC